MKYQVEITKLGADALIFLEDEETNMIIIFNDDAPEELAELSVMHEKGQMSQAPAPGDTMKICDKEYRITAVGSEAPKTLEELGHCTLSFKGGTEAERPGCIMLEGEPLLPDDIRIGGMIEIF